jgi:hypothetical protein
VEYERDEDNPEIARAILTFECNVNEVISWSIFIKKGYNFKNLLI